MFSGLQLKCTCTCYNVNSLVKLPLLPWICLVGYNQSAPALVIMLKDRQSKKLITRIHKPILYYGCARLTL